MVSDSVPTSAVFGDVAIPANVSKAYDFEVAQRATVPADTADAAPGTLLKLEAETDTSVFTIPPGLALSRFVCQSQTPGGHKVPVSAFVLWPYTARPHPSGYPFIAWGHGTSGITAKSAPSGIANLWQHFMAPFQLALAGYVVVAPDYKGLGVARDATGVPIVHNWVNGPDQAEDLYWAVPAARAAFPELSKEFLFGGHSQGGGAAWGVAQKLAAAPLDGYLGTIAGSPATTWLDQPETEEFFAFGIIYMTPGIEALAPAGQFRPSDVLTEAGVWVLETLQRLQGCNAVMFQLLAAQTAPLLRPGWRDNPCVQAYQAQARVGRRDLRGPLLVTQGDADPIVNYTVVTNAVEDTARALPDQAIDYHRLRYISHNPSMPNALQIWLGWIAARFAGAPVAPGLRKHETRPTRPQRAMQAEQNWVLELQRYSWQSE